MPGDQPGPCTQRRAASRLTDAPAKPTGLREIHSASSSPVALSVPCLATSGDAERGGARVELRRERLLCAAGAFGRLRHGFGRLFNHARICPTTRARPTVPGCDLSSSPLSTPGTLRQHDRHATSLREITAPHPGHSISDPLSSITIVPPCLWSCIDARHRRRRLSSSSPHPRSSGRCPAPVATSAAAGRTRRARAPR